MAPPSNRRSGFSRRAQYGTFFGYVAGIGLAMVAAGIVFYSISNPQAFSGLRGIASDATRPTSQIAAEGRDESRGFFSAIAGYFAAGSQNARLRREAEEARVRLIEAEATSQENRRLKALLGLAQQDPRPVAFAVMIASTSSSTRRFATISAGAAQGVQTGMPVLSPMGLLGRVLETGQSSARVLLVTDSESVVPVRRARDDVAGFAQGHADGTLQIRLINLGINPLKRGDTLVTSGSGGLYRPGIPIAVVTHLTRDGAIARVLADPAGSEHVAIEPVWALPAAPAPTPAPASAASPAPEGAR